MKTNNTSGRTFALVIGIYLVVKAVLNMILGGSFADIVIGIVYAAFLFSGLEFVNYAIALLLAVTVLRHIGYNISNLPGTLIYLIEAAADIAAAAVICLQKDVRAHFTNKWTELKELFSK